MEELKNIGSIAQMGVFGLLCAIAYWLMRHIPIHFQSLADERKSFAGATVQAATEHRAANRESLSEFAQQMREERQSCERSTQAQREADERRHQELMAALEKNHAETMRAIADNYGLMREGNHEVRNLAQVYANDRATREMKRQPQKSKEP